MVDLEEVAKIIAALTPAQRKALLYRQLAMFERDTIVAKGGAVGALRRRGCVKGRMLTEIGEAVVERLEAAVA